MNLLEQYSAQIDKEISSLLERLIMIPGHWGEAMRRIDALEALVVERNTKIDQLSQMIADIEQEADELASAASEANEQLRNRVQELEARGEPVVVEWDGEGLPPVGAVVGAASYIHATPLVREWRPVNVLAHGNSQGVSVAICQDGDTIHVAAVEDLRPIRTPEQIEVEERERITGQMIRDAGVACGSVEAGVIYDLYTLGYRKQV